MTLALTQSDFRANLKEYLNKVNSEEETVYIARSNQRAVAVISQEKMAWLERAIKAKEGSLEYAVAVVKFLKQINNRPRKLFVWRSADEYYLSQVFHLD